MNLPKSLKSFYNWVRRTPIDDLALQASKSNIDDMALGALDAVDDVPSVKYLSPRNVGLADDVFSDSTVHLGKYYDEPVLGIRNGQFHEIVPDSNATIQVPEVPLDDLVFAQHIADPSVISVRPHKNTALGRWFQNQAQNLSTPNSFEFYGDSLDSDKFVEIFNKKRLAERAMNNSLNNSVSFDDADLPF